MADVSVEKRVFEVCLQAEEDRRNNSPGLASMRQQILMRELAREGYAPEAVDELIVASMGRILANEIELLMDTFDV